MKSAPLPNRQQRTQRASEEYKRVAHTPTTTLTTPTYASVKLPGQTMVMVARVMVVMMVTVIVVVAQVAELSLMLVMAMMISVNDK